MTEIQEGTIKTFRDRDFIMGVERIIEENRYAITEFLDLSYNKTPPTIETKTRLMNAIRA